MKDLRYFTLNDGHKAPSFGIGVYTLTPEEAEKAVYEALMMGIRHIDTANAYFNEKAVGRAIKKSGISREEIFLTTKLWPTQYQEAGKAIEDTLSRLDTPYIDLLLLHQPYGDYMAAYSSMCEAVKEGKVKSIGLSNFDEANFKKFLEIADHFDIKPAVLQIECHPYYPQEKIIREISKYGTLLESWYPFGHGDKALLNEPILKGIGNKYGKKPAQVILRWLIQRNIFVFPASRNPEHIKENFEIFDFELSDDDMKEISKLDKNTRYFYMAPEEASKMFLSWNCDFNKQE